MPSDRKQDADDVAEAQDMAEWAAMYRHALYDLLDLLERGDGFQQQERMQRAGKLLGLARYDGQDGAGTMGS